MLSTPWWLPPPEVVLGYQHALLSDFRLVPARHSARRSIVVPLLELTSRDPCYTRNTGIVHPPLGMTAPGLQTLASSPHERSEMRETPDVIGATLARTAAGYRHSSAPRWPHDLSVQIFALQPHVQVKLEVIFLSIRTYGIVNLELLIVFIHLELAARASLSLNRSSEL